MSVKVSSKYQVVIPEKVRHALDLQPGTEVDVIAKGGIAYIVPVRKLSFLADNVKAYLSESDRKTVRNKTERKL